MNNQMVINSNDEMKDYDDNDEAINIKRHFSQEGVIPSSESCDHETYEFPLTISPDDKSFSENNIMNFKKSQFVKNADGQLQFRQIDSEKRQTVTRSISLSSSFASSSSYGIFSRKRNKKGLSFGPFVPFGPDFRNRILPGISSPE